MPYVMKHPRGTYTVQHFYPLTTSQWLSVNWKYLNQMDFGITALENPRKISRPNAEIQDIMYYHEVCR